MQLNCHCELIIHKCVAYSSTIEEDKIIWHFLNITIS